MLGGARIFVDQAAQDGFSDDPFTVVVGNGEMTAIMLAVGNALGDALVRPGRVVVHLVLSQDGAQVALAEDQHAIEELPAQDADEALADRVHPRSLDGRAHDPGAGGLEDGVERDSEVRSAITHQEPDALEPLTEGEGKVVGLLHCPVPGGVRSYPAQMHPAGSMLDEHQHSYRRFSSTVSPCRKSTARIRQPGHAGTAATWGLSGVAPDQCPQ